MRRGELLTHDHTQSIVLTYPNLLKPTCPFAIDAILPAVTLSNPTVPFPPEYPDEQGRFIVTFYFNEQPPNGGSH